MTQNLNSLIAQVRRKISDYQAVLYLLNKIENREEFFVAPQLAAAVVSGDKVFVKDFLKTDLSALSLGELRDVAKRRGIHPVFGRTKCQLILAITEKDYSNV